MIATVTIDLDADGHIATIHNVANRDELRAVIEGTTYDIGAHGGRIT